jgi:hypothetical protein
MGVPTVLIEKRIGDRKKSKRQKGWNVPPSNA